MSREPAPIIGRERMFLPGKKRVLTLDGGGTRGIVSIMFLKRMETLLREQSGRPDLVLADVFDIVAGTSVGSMLATMVALGHAADDIEAVFLDLAPKIFAGRVTMFGHHRFDARPLVNGIRHVVKDRTLGSDDLRTGLVIVAKRADTGSVWVLSNNPRMPFYEDGPDWDGNKHYKLETLIRASTAAPFLFTPTEIVVHTNRFGKEVKGLFVDGGVSPHNNPSLQLLLMAALPSYKLDWTLSPDDLMLISVGTGSHRTPIEGVGRVIKNTFLRGTLGRERCDDIDAAAFAAKTLQSVINDNSAFVLKLMQSVSRPRFSWKINSEVGDLSADLLLGALRERGTQQELLRFQRYDLPLETGGVVPSRYDIQASMAERIAMQPIDKPENIPKLRAWAEEVAHKQVSLEDFAGFL
ncbi:MAG: patatin-like phospholipase family protein [Hyphomicrobiaceae bacterium]|nr:patatin-like phospholipase family protein [Hyphomicrobiaceae bacterium]